MDTESIKNESELLAAQSVLTVHSLFSQFSPVGKFVLVGGLIGLIPLYFVTRFASHTYYTEKYKSYAVTARASFTNPKDVSAGTVGVVLAGSGQFAGFVQVKNENLDLALADATYTFRFYNAQNGEVYTISGQFFLLPNQQKYLVIPKIPVKVTVERGEITFSHQHWVKRFAIPPVSVAYTTPRWSYQTDPQSFIIEGSITNQSAYVLSTVKLVLVAFNEMGQVVAISQREEYTLQPNKLRSFQQVISGLSPEGVTKVVVYPDVNTLDNSNLRPLSSNSR